MRARLPRAWFYPWRHATAAPQLCDHDYVSYVIAEPTCTDEGIIEQTCEKCGEKIYSDIQPLGHKYVNGICARCGQSDGTVQPEAQCEHEYDGTIVIEPTCIEAGVIELVCAKCDNEVVSAVAPLGHKYVNGICARCGQSDGTVSPVCEHEYGAMMIAEPTCTEAGSIELVCSKCGNESITEVPALGHKYVNGICTRCGQSDGTVSPVCEHEYSAMMIAEPTCTEAGSVELVCSKCGDQSTAEIPALGHKYVNGVCTRCGQRDGTVSPTCEHDYDATVVAEPTCTETGSIELVCSKCGDQSTAEIPALGHKYVNGVCTRCGQRDPDESAPDPEPDLTLFTDMDDAFALSKKLGYIFSENQFIDGLCGMSFTKLFTNKNGHLKVTSYNISADIGDMRVDIPVEGAAEVGLINGIYISLEGELTIIDSTGITKSFGFLEPYVTTQSTWITAVALNMQNELLLLDSSDKIIKAGFIAKDEAPEVVDDLILYYGTKSSYAYTVYGAFDRTIEYAEIAPTHLGKPVTAIAANAFYGYTSLKGVTIPEGISSIQSYAFATCTALEYVVISSTMYYISNGIFDGCTSLKTVFFNGTKAQWNKLSGYRYIDELPGVTVYFYSEVGPVVGENYWHMVDGKPVIW